MSAITVTLDQEGLMAVDAKAAESNQTREQFVAAAIKTALAAKTAPVGRKKSKEVVTDE